MKNVTVVVESSKDYTEEGKESDGTNFLTVLLHHRTNGIFGKTGFPTKYYAWGQEQTPGEVHVIDLHEYQIQNKYKIKLVNGTNKLCRFRTLVHLSIAPDVNPLPEKTQEQLHADFPEYFAKEIAEAKAQAQGVDDVPF